MKRISAILLCALVALNAIVAVGANEASAASQKKISVVTTIFPQYDWVKQITAGSDSVDLTMLLDNGVDLHSYQPTVDDIVKISTCDVFIYVGGESDEWIEDVLETAKNKNMTVINLLEVLGDQAKEEELVEGMQGEEEEEEDEAEEEGPEYDEHVWLSLRNAQTFCKTICSELCQVDPGNAQLYTSNCNLYCEKLTALDVSYTKAVQDSAKDTLLFGDRFPFRYLVDDYGLSYYAAFVGCSAETEASFDTIVFLSEKLRSLDLNAVMQLESANGKIAQTIISTAKVSPCQILTLDSMQSTSAKDIADGVTYLSIMESNLAILKQALR